MGSSLDDKYSVTQLPPGDYYYVKWWGGGPILLAITKEARKKIPEWHLKAQLLCFYLSLYFGDSGNPESTFSHIFEGLTVFHQRVPKIQAMRGLGPCYGLVKWPHG